MALLYNAKIKMLDKEKKSITVLIESIHPDALYFSDNLGFAMRLVHDSASGDSPLGKAVDYDCLLNKEWMLNNVKGIISSAKLLEIIHPKQATIVHKPDYSLWRGEVEQAIALLEINFTHDNWLSHLSPHSQWKSTAYDLEVDYKAFDNNSLVLDESISMDYKNSGGWLLIPSDNLLDNSINLPTQLYVPKYSAKSYIKATKFTVKDINSDLLAGLLYKTVYILTRNTNKAFGVLLPYEDKFCVVNIKNSGYSRAFFTMPELFTICEAAFNQNDPFLVNIFE